MPTFKELWIWQEAHQLMIEIHKFAKTLPREERFRKQDQIERSSSSVPDNIAEGYSSYYYNDKIKGMYIARKEAGETQNHLEALVGKENLSRVNADNWIGRYERVIAGINSYINSLVSKLASLRGSEATEAISKEGLLRPFGARNDANLDSNDINYVRSKRNPNGGQGKSA